MSNSAWHRPRSASVELASAGRTTESYQRGIRLTPLIAEFRQRILDHGKRLTAFLLDRPEPGVTPVQEFGTLADKDWVEFPLRKWTCHLHWRNKAFVADELS
jgi:hypothetical protein